MIQVGLVNHIWKHGPVGGVKGGEGAGREDGLDVTGALQWNFSIKGILNHRAVYKSTSELGTPLYTGQPAGSQWCLP